MARHGTAPPQPLPPRQLPKPLSRAAGSAPMQPSKRWCSSGPEPPTHRLSPPASGGLSPDSDRAPPGDNPAPGWPQGSGSAGDCRSTQMGQVPSTPHIPCPTAEHPGWALSTLRAPSPTACSAPYSPAPLQSTTDAPTPLQSTRGGHRAPCLPPALLQSTQSRCPAPHTPPAPLRSTQGGHRALCLPPAPLHDELPTHPSPTAEHPGRVPSPPHARSPTAEPPGWVPRHPPTSPSPLQSIQGGR